MKFVRLVFFVAAACGVAWFWMPETQTPLSSEESLAETGEDRVPAASELVVRESESSDWEPPFPQKDDLFSAPVLERPQLPQAETVANSRVAVRVIGFIEVEGSPPAAVLDMGGSPVIASIGEVVADIEVVAVSDPDVTLQRNGHRWSVNLYDQMLDSSSFAVAGASDNDWQRDAFSGSSDSPMTRIAPNASNSVEVLPPLSDLDDELPELELPELNDVPVLPDELRLIES